MLYVSNNTHPECTYTINACAQHWIAPQKSHAEAVKRIGQYLKGCIDDGLIIKHDKKIPLTLDCHCDADFAGNYNKIDSQDPSSVKSKTGFIITLRGVLVIWASKMQTEIALSTMEAEHTFLSTAMRLLIHLCSLCFKMNDGFDLDLVMRVTHFYCL